MTVKMADQSDLMSVCQLITGMPNAHDGSVILEGLADGAGKRMLK